MGEKQSNSHRSLPDGSGTHRTRFIEEFRLWPKMLKWNYANVRQWWFRPCPPPLIGIRIQSTFKELIRENIV